MLRKILIAVAIAFLTPVTAHAEWYAASSEHFLVYADNSPQEIKAFSERLEKYDKAMRVLRRVSDLPRGPASRVTVYMDGSLDDIHKLYSSTKNDVAGFYIPRASGSVAFVPRSLNSNLDLSAFRVLLHEYAHHFMYNDWPTALFPRWFSEGFAEFHSTAIFNNNGSITFGAPPLNRGYGVTMVNEMPLSKMLRTDLTKLSSDETYALYSRGWLLMHFLTFEPERRKQLSDYITAINDGKPIAQAMAVFGDLNSLDMKLTSYVKRPQFQSAVVPAKDLAIGEITLRALTPGEAATMRAQIRLQRSTNSNAAAEQVAQMARAAAAPYPNDAGAQNVLAEAEYDVDDFAATKAAADRALAADPKSIHALLYRGMALQGVAEKDRSTDVKQWQEVRKWYLAANKIDALDPQPLILFYRSFGPSGQPVTKNADDALLFASKLAPYEYGLRYTAAKIYLKNDKAEDARRELRMIAFLPHGGDAADRANKAIAALDKSGSAAALAMIRASESQAMEEAKKAPATGGSGSHD